MNESFIQSNYANDKYTSLAALLKPKGYTSAFFHGGTNGTMGFDSYTHMVGFDRYYGRTEYNNDKDFDGEWGIRDEEFFQYTAQTINGFKPPFLVAIFSLSSHHPFTVPARYGNKFREGHMPIQKTIMYADYSLGRFFETAKKMPWFDNTLFVITADHTSEGYYPYYHTDAGQFAVPIIFYKHNSGLRGDSKIVAQQIDIMPSVLSLLGYDKDFLAYGTNLFDSTAQHFSIHNASGLFGLIKEGYLLEFDGTNSTGLYDLKKDSLQKSNLVGKGLEVKKDLEIFMKAFLQQYNNRIIENRLIID
jgi:phosphoglycerol transferase MdoB-like AlkP superfamily enzyme